MLMHLASRQWMVTLALAAACTQSGTADPTASTGASGQGGAHAAGASGASSGTGGASGASSGTGGASGASSGAAGASAGAGGASDATDASADVSVVPHSDAMDAGSDAPIVAAFAEQALAIAANYKSWGRVDDELRWAPFLCRIPLPAVARTSQSDDPSTHGQKLYSVFVKNRDAYPTGPHSDQVVVKESWVPEIVTTPDASFVPASLRTSSDGTVTPIDADHFYAYAKGDGGVIYRAAAPAGLFVMFKVTPATPDTDQGWVYATVSTQGQVTAAGRVASCMGCHESAEHERLFGVPKSNFN